MLLCHHGAEQGLGLLLILLTATFKSTVHFPCFAGALFLRRLCACTSCWQLHVSLEHWVQGQETKVLLRAPVAAMKRPAAACKDTDGPEGSKVLRMLEEKLAVPKVHTLFEPAGYVEKLAKALKLQRWGPEQLSSPLLWGGAFDGSNMPAQCMKVFKNVLGIKSQQLVGRSSARTLQKLLGHGNSSCFQAFLLSS